MKGILDKVAMLMIVLSLLFGFGITANAASEVTKGGTEANWNYTAKYESAISESQQYLMIVIKDSSLGENESFPANLVADDILYINQKTVTSSDVTNGYILFENFIPITYEGGTVFISGGTLDAPVNIGNLPEHGVLGDASSDGSVNIFDILTIRDYLLQTSSITGTNLLMADVTKDGYVNVFDILRIRDYLLGIQSSL